MQDVGCRHVKGVPCRVGSNVTGETVNWYTKEQETKEIDLGDFDDV